MDGQVTVYNLDDGPCYRCLFPKPPPPETVSNCSDNGVLGAITGVIGSLQALEVIKLIVRKSSSLKGNLLLFDGDSSSFRGIRLRKKRADCPVCGDNPTITQLIDYVAFCGSGAHDKTLCLDILPRDDRVSVDEFLTILQSQGEFTILDVREAVQYEICSFKDSIHIPFKDLEALVASLEDYKNSPVYVICRLGNDSQLQELSRLCNLPFRQR